LGPGLRRGDLLIPAKAGIPFVVPANSPGWSTYVSSRPRPGSKLRWSWY